MKITTGGSGTDPSTTQVHDGASAGVLNDIDWGMDNVSVTKTPTIVHDISGGTYIVNDQKFSVLYSNSWITDALPPENIDIYEYVCDTLCDETVTGGEKPG